MTVLKPLRWNEEHARVDLLDQTRLPMEERWMEIPSVEAMAEAIRSLRVRGAPAIGVAAAYGVVLAAAGRGKRSDALAAAREAILLLRATRPTAVNLFAALDRMQHRIEHLALEPAAEPGPFLLSEARAIEREEEDSGRRIAEEGLPLLSSCRAVMTHCNAGGLATAGWGTALAPLLLAARHGTHIHVYVNETRPLLQGSRITSWELQRAGVPCTLITDSMAGHVMQRGLVDAVIVGADRVAANGDTANKIGTYALAVLARFHGLPFYVAIPTSTLDPGTAAGGAILIEERHPDEVTHPLGVQAAPAGTTVYNPAFDVTPHALISAFITDRGVVYPPFEDRLVPLTGKP